MKLIYQFAAIVAILMASGSCTSQQEEGTKASSRKDSETPIVTGNGIGELTLGTSLTECLPYVTGNMYPVAEELLQTEEKKFGFYDNTGIEQVEFNGYPSPYLLLYDKSELMAAIPCGGLFDNTEIYEILVYSPNLKMNNGIHTGLSAKELVNDFGAEIRYEESEEFSLLTFEIPDIPSNIKLVGTAKKINQDKMRSEYSSAYDGTCYLQLDDVEDCTLSMIVITRKQESYGTY